MLEIYPLIVAALTGNFGLLEAEIRPEANFGELGLDSMALVELSIVVQEQTGVLLEEVDRNATLAEIAACLERAIAGRRATVGDGSPAFTGAANVPG